MCVIFKGDAGNSGYLDDLQVYMTIYEQNLHVNVNSKVHPCTGTEALYRPYGP